MSRIGIIIGLMVSVTLHWWLVQLQTSFDQTNSDPPNSRNTVDVVEMTPLTPDEKLTDQQTSDQPESKSSHAKLQPKPIEPAIARSPQTSAPQEIVTPSGRQVKLVQRISSSPSDLPGGGDFAGSQEGKSTPGLRIGWGDWAQASHIMQQGRMKLIVIDNGTIVQQVQTGDNQLSLAAFEPEVGTNYSNRLRIVQNVPAFMSLVDSLGINPPRMLAVMVPTDIEQMLQTAQLGAAFDQGLAMADVQNFAGNFVMADKRLSFKITHIHRRR